MCIVNIGYRIIELYIPIRHQFGSKKSTYLILILYVIILIKLLYQYLNENIKNKNIFLLFKQFNKIKN